MQKNMAQRRTWLASHGPIMVALNVDATWDNATATHGILDPFQPNTTRGGHAACLVGYTREGRFIVRNSWRRDRKRRLCPVVAHTAARRQR
jgi:hypothetical protein